MISATLDAPMRPARVNFSPRRIPPGRTVRHFHAHRLAAPVRLEPSGTNAEGPEETASNAIGI
jgi:hypothetical protein